MISQRSFLSLQNLWLLGACVLISGVAQAAEQGWFAGAHVGPTKFKGYELEGDADKLDDSDKGWAVEGGYRWGLFALSVGYSDLGQLEASAGSDYQPPEGRSARGVKPRGVPIFTGFEDRIEASGATVFGTGILPLSSRVQLLGHAGLYRWKQKVDYREPGFSSNLSASGTDPMFGFGVNVFLTPTGTWSISTSYMRHLNVGNLDKTGHENDIDMISIGTVYHFGKP